MKLIPSDMKKFVALSVILTTAMIAGCGSIGKTQEPISEAESCDRLMAIINDHPSNFKNLPVNCSVEIFEMKKHLRLQLEYKTNHFRQCCFTIIFDIHISID